MNAAVLVILGIFLFAVLGYRIYSRHLAQRVFQLTGQERTPAHDPELQDGVDYCPTNPHVLWGHHFTSIAGAAPIIGPAIAIIWGWVPAFLWVVFGTIFIGAVHDFGALVVSARHRGHTMGNLAGTLIHPRVRILFQIIVYFLIWVVLAVFAQAIGKLFIAFPQSIIPVNFEIIAAVVIGLVIYRVKARLLIPSILALLALYGMVGVGVWVHEAGTHIALPETLEVGGLLLSNQDQWVMLLLIYSFVASVLPVWLLLQPRDYINSHQLIVGLIALVGGILVLQPEMQAPALNLSPAGAPPIFPLIFVTIACGAISGFHGFVSSGTTSKQLDRMPQARPIGYGGMLGEGTLALVATLAVSAGLADWAEHYSSWQTASGQGVKFFVEGAATFLGAIAIPMSWAGPLVAVLVISFAATSLDTATRIQRIIVQELGGVVARPLPPLGRLLQNRFVAGVLAVGPAIWLAFSEQMGALWHLFGTTNQLVGGMTLLVLFVYLVRSRRPVVHYAVPMLFVVVVTTAAMVLNLIHWTQAEEPNPLTIGVGGVILLLEIWMMVEAALVVRRLPASSS